MKLLSVREIQASGLLQEVNRLFLHPRGMALTIEVGGAEGDRIVGIQDARDDSEGFVFSTLLDGPDGRADALAASVQALADDKAPVRLAAFGWVIQPVGSVVP